MIPLARNSARRNAASAIVVSRQGLPRPARLYSSPTKNAQSPATGFASPTPPPSAFPPFMPAGQPPQGTIPDMQSFLKKRSPYTIVPTPLPNDRTSPLNDFYFTDSPTQDSVSIMDACLHNLHDVPRAKQIFDQLRGSGKGDAVLDASTYNAFLDAYLEMSCKANMESRAFWIDDVTALYDEMENGGPVQPTHHTYACMLRLHYHSRSGDGAKTVMKARIPSPEIILRAMVDRQIPATLVVSHRSIESSEQANAIIKNLSAAAVSMGLAKVVTELGMATSLGSTVVDPLGDVPEAVPVLKVKKTPQLNVSRAEDGRITEISPAEPVKPEYEIPFHLDNLRKHLAQVLLTRRVLSDDASSRQKLLEESVYDIAAARMKYQADLFSSLGLSNNLGHADLRAWMWDWHTKLRDRLRDRIAKIGSSRTGLSKEGRQLHGLLPYLTLLKPETMSIITILELMHLQGTGGVSDGMKTARAILVVGMAVEAEHKASMCKKNNIAVPAPSGRGTEHGFFSNLGYRDLHARRVAARRFMEDAEDWTAEWSQVTRVRLGSFLVDNLMAVATITRTALDKKTGEDVTEEHPALFHSYEYLRGHKLGVIRLHPSVAERIAKDSIADTMHPRHLPMLVKPKPWVSPTDGGYFYNKTSVMRYKESVEQQAYLERAAELGNVELVFAGLDVLGSTPWRINRPIFDVVLKVWNAGIRMPKIPPATFDHPDPEKPLNADVDQKARTVYITRMQQHQVEKSNNHSERCNVNYKVEIARTFLGDTFYMPHNVDFRGRAYPIPPHLNHIGDDLSRGLLKFAEARPLGERGLRWMKIHLANLYGFDKASFDDREKFADEHLKEIYDSAERPLEGERWWTKADDPWQCLATCMELRAALESPNPLEFESDLPVHQDGTCNGLQHYAALGGDAQGARQVNLDVTDKPADVYTYVADMVKAQIEKDLAVGDEWAQRLDGKITRKVVKQTVMTTVYGVTFVGARDQIEKQLRDRGDIAPEFCWGAAAYLAKNVLNSIGNLFTGAKNIQVWLNACARLISKSIPPERLQDILAAEGKLESRVRKEQMTSVVWTTPLGMPVVQPYRQVNRKQVTTSLQTVFISDPSSMATVNSLKQATAFPPNFIHSLDATHMMLTALECKTRGITFASVHDSYWTHACSVDEMSSIIRDTFVALHSREVLKNLAEEFRERYKDFKIHISAVRMVQNAEVQKLAEEAYNRGLAANEKSFAEMLNDHKEMDDGDADEMEEADEEEKPKKRKPGRKSKVMTAEGFELSEINPAAWFNLTDLIPPVPEKGKFDVNTIKRSLYFFS